MFIELIFIVILKSEGKEIVFTGFPKKIVQQENMNICIKVNIKLKTRDLNLLSKCICLNKNIIINQYVKISKK